MNVSGISPPRTLAIDASRIIMNTIPLAPSTIVLETARFTSPVTSAVTRIIASSRHEPWRSSRIGPISKISMKLPSRCSQLSWPRICPTSPTYVGAPRRNGYARNHTPVSGSAELTRNTTTAAIVNVSTTGALYVIRSFTKQG
jgi:hypothetical protein